MTARPSFTSDLLQAAEKVVDLWNIRLSVSEIENTKRMFYIEEANSAYIALASPANIIELVRALDAARNEALEKAAQLMWVLGYPDKIADLIRSIKSKESGHD